MVFEENIKCLNTLFALKGLLCFGGILLSESKYFKPFMLSFVCAVGFLNGFFEVALEHFDADSNSWEHDGLFSTKQINFCF